MFSLTVTSIEGQPSAVTRGFWGKRIVNLRPSTEGDTGSAARFEYAMSDSEPPKTYAVSQTYASVLASASADEAESGAQLTAEKDASGGYAGLTLFKINFLNVLGTFVSFFTNSNTAARTYTFQDRNGTIADDTDLGLKINTSAKDATGGVAGLTLFKINFKNAANTFTSFFTNTNTAARTYTFQDRDGTIADDTDLALKAPLASPTFTGTAAAPTAASGTNTTQLATTAFVQNAKSVTGTASGTDTYTVTFAPVVTPAAGSLVAVRFTNANTGAATLNATAIVRKDGSTALSANDILANSWYQLLHDGTSYVLLGSA
jgi:hypothetical protein